jgi:hypothetical protein
MPRAYYNGSQAALEKFAARRGMKEILQAVSGGNLGRANTLATTPGVLKPSPFGAQIKDLGAGGEGLATLVAHPDHGIAVRKMFDPNAGMFSPELAARKANIGPLPGVAKTLGAGYSPAGAPMHFNEFVQGKQVTPEMLKNDPSVGSQYMKSMIGAQRGAKQKGMRLLDTRAANAVQQPDGSVKFIDHLPFKPNEVADPALASQHRKSVGDHVVVTTDEAPKIGPGQLSRFSEEAHTVPKASIKPGADPEAAAFSNAHNRYAQGMNDAFKRYSFTGQLPARMPAQPALPVSPSMGAPTAPARPPMSPPSISPSEMAAYGANMGAAPAMPPTAPIRRR